MTDGLSAVLARISQIESMIAPAPASGVLGGSSSSTSTSSTGTDFANTLDQVGTGSATGSGSGTTTGDSTGTGALGEQAVAIAAKYLGTPYRWGGTDPKTGLDCSGFTQLVFKQVGVTLPRVSADQARTGTAVASLAQAKPGDLVFFGSPVHHVGIYLGGGKMIDAPRTGEDVKIQSVYETPSQIRRVLPAASSQLASSSLSGTSTVSNASVSAALLSSAASGYALTGATPDLSALLSSSGVDPADSSDATAAASTTALNSLSQLTAGASSPSTTGTRTGTLGNTPYAALFTSIGQSYGIDPALLSAVAKTESGYDANAVSGAGAQGLMQLMPSTAAGLGIDPTDPAQAIQGAAKLLSDNLRTFNGRVDLALAAYNAGAGAVRKYGGVPPYSETRSYVQQVQQNWGKLR